MSAEKVKNPHRRKILGATAAGVAVGLAGGAMLGQASNPPSLIERGGKRFENKVVVVTGATSGIGRAAALAFAAEGAKVGFCGRREHLGKEVEREIIAKSGEATYVKADVLVERDVKAFIDTVVTKYGRLDVAFNNAGITMEKPLHEFGAQEWDAVVNTNLRGVFLAMKYEIPHLLAAGGGNIVVNSSNNAIITKGRRSAYAASKHGLIGLVQAAALDYATKGIRVNAILPGTTNTDLVRKVAGMEKMPDTVWKIGAKQWAKSNVPSERMATPEEIAAFVLVLASDDHPFMTGSAMVFDGGKTAGAG